MGIGPAIAALLQIIARIMGLDKTPGEKRADTNEEVHDAVGAASQGKTEDVEKLVHDKLGV